MTKIKTYTQKAIYKFLLYFIEMYLQIYLSNLPLIPILTITFSKKAMLRIPVDVNQKMNTSPIYGISISYYTFFSKYFDITMTPLFIKAYMFPLRNSR